MRMDQTSSSERHSAFRLGFFLGMALLAGAASVVARPAAAQLFNPSRPSSEESDNVFIVPDRELRQLIDGAKEAIDQERYGDAVDALNALLVDPQMEDYFLSAPGAATQLSLKAEARKLLGNMPPAGREAYEQKFGHDAREMLNQAIQEGNPEKLSQVARLYFHSQAGMEAAMLLGRLHLNRGRPLAGALWLKRLAEAAEQTSLHGQASASYNPAVKYDPDLSILLAECWLEAGLTESAKQTLIDLKQRSPKAKVRIGDETISLFTEDARALEWMDALLVARRDASGGRGSDWTLYRGNPARNAQTDGGFPLPQFVWQAPTSNDPGDRELISSIEKSEFRSAQIPALPAGQPLAVGDLVVMRTPEQVVGIDFREGKRVWLFPPPNSIFDRSLEFDDALPTTEAADVTRKELKQRIWEDAPYGQLSSDSEAVYFVHDLGYAFEGMRQTLIQQQGIPMPNPKYPKSFNQLVALDLKGEGKLRWIVGGENGENEPRLAGAFFLGPPLPLSGQLYVLAEVNAEIRLVVLDAQTGQLQWAQQLAHVDPSDASILYDNPRRLAGATPSFADGVLVCPTSAGAVVAVDVAARSLLWGYQYRRNMTTQPIPNAFGPSLQTPRDIGKRWADALGVISHGRVLVTPVESDYLHCLDLLTGAMLWQQPRGESLFIGGVHEGRAIVVGKTHVTVYDVATGKLAWELEVGLPTGRGFLSQGHYYQPVYHASTSDAGEQNARFELVRIDLSNKAIETVEADLPLGNLVCHRDQIISQGAQWVGAVYQVDPLRKTVEDRLAKNADDPWALARKAQLLRHDGKDREALVALRQSHAAAPDDYTRQLLIDTLLKFLASDFAAHREFVEEIQDLDPAADQRGKFLRLLIAGYQSTGEPEKAFEACLKLAGLDAQESAGTTRPPMDQVGSHLTVRRDRWIRARMKELIDGAAGDQRAAIDAAIAERWEETLKSDMSSDLSRFVNYFGAHPLADRARLRLAEKLMESSSLLEAELLLVKLEDSAEEAIAARATLAMARLLERAQRWREAAHSYRRLQEQWPDVVVENGLTGSQLVAALPTESPLQAALRGTPDWPDGRVQTSTTNERLSLSTYQKVYPIEVQDQRGALPRGVRVAFDQQQQQLIVRDGEGRILSSILVTNPHQSMRYPIPSSNTSVYHAKANGHLLLVSFGVQLMAFNILEDSRPPGESVLWTEDVDHELDAAISRRSRVMHLPQHNPWGDASYYAAGANSMPVGRFGPLNEHGVCFQRRSELVCIHPLTGETIWVRENVEPGSELFGDEDYLFVIPHNGRQAMVLNALDGSLVGYRDVPSRSNRWTTVGRKMLSFRQEGLVMKLRMNDLLEPSPQDWERSFAVESKGAVVERNKLAVLEPGGKFVLLSLETGDTLVEKLLDEQRALESIYVLPSHDRFLLFTRTTYRDEDGVSYQPPSIPDAPLVNGYAYAFDRATGESLWPAPAYLEQYGLPLDQPTETPVVLLMRRETPSSAQQRRSHLAIMCLDRRDGSLLFEKSDAAIAGGAGNDKYTLEADPANSAVNLTLPSGGVTLKFTDEPQPPRPPLETGARGASAVPASPGVNAVGAVFRAIGAGGQPALRGPVPPPPLPFGLPAAPPAVRLNAAGQVVPLFPPRP